MEAAESEARDRGIQLTATHWLVLCRAREECLSGLRLPDTEELARAAGLSPEEFHALFPGDACALIARLAGLDGPPCGWAP